MSPQWVRLPNAEGRILMIRKLKPTEVVPTEVRLVLSEIESIEGALIAFRADPNGYKVLTIYGADIDDFCGNWSHTCDCQVRLYRSWGTAFITASRERNQRKSKVWEAFESLKTRSVMEAGFHRPAK